jgi:hypothetical protein
MFHTQIDQAGNNFFLLFKLGDNVSTFFDDPLKGKFQPIQIKKVKGICYTHENTSSND